MDVLNKVEIGILKVIRENMCEEIKKRRNGRIGEIKGIKIKLVGKIWINGKEEEIKMRERVGVIVDILKIEKIINKLEDEIERGKEVN